MRLNSTNRFKRCYGAPSSTNLSRYRYTVKSRPQAPPRLVGIALGVVLALAVGFLVGRAVGPTGSASPAAGATIAADGHNHGSTAVSLTTEVGGLAVAAGGYTLSADTAPFAAGTAKTFRFRVYGANRTPVTTFAVAHEKLMHLVVVRRDLTGYQHLHPTMAQDGTWSVDLRLPEPGVWRAYADFAVIDASRATTAVTLGVDLTAAGPYQPKALPEPDRASTVDGLTVTYEGTPAISATQALVFRVPAPVERYLGAYGHLVVLREGDLGYVHVHPEDQLLGGAVKFWLAAPSAGRYRMFFDFQVAGKVHTAEYTLVVR
jgi:hypothetical protein